MSTDAAEVSGRRSLYGKRGRPAGVYGKYKKRGKPEALSGVVSLKTGDRVEHAVHGRGRVLEEWGSWRACRACFGEVDVVGEECPLCGNGPGVQAGGEAVGLYWQRVSGAGVYDVLFDGDRRCRSINEEWLRDAA